MLLTLEKLPLVVFPSSCISHRGKLQAECLLSMINPSLLLRLALLYSA